MYCQKCGKELEETMEFCPSCGSRQGIRVPDPLPQKMDPDTNSTASMSEQQKKEETQEQAKRVAAKKRIEEMFSLCSTEQEFLMLRPQILQTPISDAEKAVLLQELDIATSVRLESTLELAEDYEEIKESPIGTIVVCCVLAGIGLAVNYFFSMKWPGIICCAIGALSIAGTMMERVDKNKVARQKEAAELIETYRKQGYKI